MTWLCGKVAWCSFFIVVPIIRELNARRRSRALFLKLSNGAIRVIGRRHLARAWGRKVLQCSLLRLRARSTVGTQLLQCSRTCSLNVRVLATDRSAVREGSSRSGRFACRRRSAPGEGTARIQATDGPKSQGLSCKRRQPLVSASLSVCAHSRRLRASLEGNAMKFARGEAHVRVDSLDFGTER